MQIKQVLSAHTNVTGKLTQRPSIFKTELLETNSTETLEKKDLFRDLLEESSFFLGTVKKYCWILIVSQFPFILNLSFLLFNTSCYFYASNPSNILMSYKDISSLGKGLSPVFPKLDSSGVIFRTLALNL